MTIGKSLLFSGTHSADISSTQRFLYHFDQTDSNGITYDVSGRPLTANTTNNYLISSGGKFNNRLGTIHAAPNQMNGTTGAGIQNYYAVSMDAWFNFAEFPVTGGQGINNNGNLMAFGGPNVFAAARIYRPGSEPARFQLARVFSSEVAQVLTSPTILPDVWHHIAVQCDLTPTESGGQYSYMHLWFNGQYLGTMSVSLLMWQFQSVYVWPSAQRAIDEFRVTTGNSTGPVVTGVAYKSGMNFTPPTSPYLP